MMFVDPLMCWECKDPSLMMGVHTNHRNTMPWSFSLTKSNIVLYIHPRDLKLPTKATMCDPVPNYRIKRYIYIADASNSSNVITKTLCNYGGTCQLHVSPLLL